MAASALPSASLSGHCHLTLNHARNACHMPIDRRNFLVASSASAAAGAGAAVGLLSGCQPGRTSAHDTTHITGGFTGIDPARGHLLRDAAKSGRAWPAPSKTFYTRTLIAGGGVAGLAAARALRLRGQDDFALLELEDEAGGNSRAGQMQGLPFALGAHYLPVPGDDAPDVQDLLEELGLRQRVAGRWLYDERHLCHSPQERLFFNDQWQTGLLPMQGISAATRLQYQKFSRTVEQLQRAARWVIPVSNRPLAPMQSALAATTFEAWLNQNQFSDTQLRWYLDYCCRDDYGAGITAVSAWAGLHYFASRHGFSVPLADGDSNSNSDSDGLSESESNANANGTSNSNSNSGRNSNSNSNSDRDRRSHSGKDRQRAATAREQEHEGLLTWPEGNAWLTRRLAAPLGERLRTGRIIVSIEVQRQGVQVDAFNVATQNIERWNAQQCIVALPIFIAARVITSPPDYLQSAAQRTRYAPWLVANLLLSDPLHDRPGAAPCWDNVIYSESHLATQAGLGYVDTTHQSLHPVPGATVLTHYRALGDHANGRQTLLERPFEAWRDQIISELSGPHPDLARKCQRMEIARYGHAMAIPVPTITIDSQINPKPIWNKRLVLSKQKQMAVQAIPSSQRLVFAHSDWAGYSIFEEAFSQGHTAGLNAA